MDNDEWAAWGPSEPQSTKPPSKKFQRKVNPNDLIMEIESGIAGKIIGKGGVKIKALKQQTGTFISVMDNDNYGLKTVKISGEPNAREYARTLIQEIIDANDPEKIRQKAIEELNEQKLTDQPLYDLDWDKLKLEKDEYIKKTLAALPPIIKNVYKEHPEVSEMTDEEVENIRASKNNIMVKYIDENNSENYKPIPKPIFKFSHAFNDYPDILKEIQKQNFEIPSPVQCQAWPIIMSGYDLIAIAQTGSGKTLAFLLPAFIHIDFQSTPRKKRKGPSILVLAPTRELVIQIESEVKKYTYKGIKVISIYGGVSSADQIECLRKGVDIVIATPGRLNDFVGRGEINLTDVTFLILDEADRMLDLGFEPQIRVSLLTVRPDRQTIMTSATWPSGVKRLAKSYTTNPIQLIIGSLDLTTVNTVKQDIIILEEEEKEYWLQNFLLNLDEDDKVIIFMNRKVNVDELSVNLALKGFTVESIHGGRDQCDRENALESLRNGEVSILLATDVASRGIDINNITVVINYDLTKDAEEYVHRVGRTGRAGKTGRAITLMTKWDWGKANDLVKVLEQSGQDVPSKLRDMANRYEAKKEKEKNDGMNRPYRRGGGRGSGDRGEFNKGYRGYAGNF